MKKLAGIFIAILIAGPLMAQKVNYKSGLLQVDEKDIAKIVRIKDKENFGLTGTYELYNMTGEKLIIATIAANFAPERGNNSNYYYRFTFLTLNQTAIFSLSKLGAEKSFAKLIGEAGIVVNDQLDAKLVTELIAMKGKEPVVAIEYPLVKRDRLGAPFLKDNEILQGLAVIGQFKEIPGRRRDLDTYEISLPTGLVVAQVSFTGGNNAQNCTITTNKDKRTQAVAIPSEGTYGKVYLRSEGMERNDMALKRVAKWLVDNWYL